MIFNTIVVMTFLVQVYNYWKLGRNEVNHYTWLFVLGGFIVTESMVAASGNPVYVLYVLLNVWGVVNLWRGR